MQCFGSIRTLPIIFDRNCRWSVKRASTCTARLPGDSSSSTRASIRTTAGCIPRTAAMPSMNTRKTWSKNPMGFITVTDLGSRNCARAWSAFPSSRPQAWANARSRCITVIMDRSFAPRMASGSPSNCCKNPCRRYRNPSCARKPPTTRHSARPRTCAPIRPTTPFMRTPVERSPTSMEISYRSAIPHSISRIRSTAAIRPRNGTAPMPSRTPSHC